MNAFAEPLLEPDHTAYEGDINTDYERRTKSGREYAATVLSDLKEKGFPGGLMHRAEEIQDPAVKVGFYAFIAEMAMKSLA